MELNRFDAVVVSAFGRGHWLATELQRDKMNVLLLDVTSKLGPWPVEDGEGPFGSVRVERFERTFLERWNHDDPMEGLENGWVLWLPEGPFELKGPLTRFHAERMGIPDRWLDALSRGERVSESLGGVPFTETWFLALAHQLAATEYRPSARAIEGGRPLPLTANMNVRFPTRSGLSRSLDWVREQGVVVSDRAEVLDLSFRGRRELTGLELRGDPNGLVRASAFVWMLTGGETEFLSPKLKDALYPGGVVAPSWCWVRYRLNAQPHPEFDRLPMHSVWIRDLDQPWTHENMMIVIKTRGEGRIDAWIRIPSMQRYNRDYLNEHGRRLMDAIAARLPLAKPEMQSLPQEASYTSQELGEPRVPIWDAGARPAKGRLKASNLWFESPENRETHGLDCEFDHHKDVRDDIARWWKALQLKAEKEKPA